jgi:hypothetical protein
VAVSALLTLVGLAEFVGQVSAARGFKAGLIAVILQSGLVVLGPVVLWAYLTVAPRGLLTSILNRLRAATLSPFKRAPRTP